jgi:hypothetical protein
MKDFITRNYNKVIIASIVLNLFLSTYSIYMATYQKSVYTIGVNRLTDSFTTGLNNTALSKEQQTDLVINFAKVLDASLEEFRSGGRLLMMEEAVLSGGVDITEQVVAKIKNGMKHYGK